MDVLEGPDKSAALETAGADTKGLKAALVERLVGVQRAAAGAAPAATPAAAHARRAASANGATTRRGNGGGQPTPMPHSRTRSGAPGRWP